MYDHLRIAYIDKPEGTKTEYAVLVKGNGPADPLDLSGNSLQEIYRIRYPDIGSLRGVIMGEGKPENQNHALMFSFGDLLQTVDMNQDNNFAEALKARNLISEFQPLGVLKSQKGKAHLQQFFNQNPQASISGTSKAIGEAVNLCPSNSLGVGGFREYVFSDRVGALGSFAAATEFAFGTLLQRVMAFPGGVRFHYGHPDMWNINLIITDQI
eukprot:TRINITY_DN12518_c0_g2_i2.p1 TRINITY_DN12518_c0_g2~~TRINITY_DN12518_c0_g2_i2.p1  ORF type:complete len:235 (-),score=37.70 TRINITY_DN12518_c0_g2_i2:23-658(-)